jgi:hypothetical protein
MGNNHCKIKKRNIFKFKPQSQRLINKHQA